MTSTACSLSRRRRRRLGRRKPEETGASIVEAAIVAPLFFLFVFAIIEVGVFLYNANAVSNASRDAAREGSTWAAGPLADYNILRAANRSLGVLAARTDAVIVFKASGPNGVVPPACVTAIPTSSRGVSDTCTIYRLSDLKTMDETSFGWSDLNTPLQNAGKLDVNWPATKRVEEVTGLVQPDWVGVYVQANHKSLSGVVPSRKIRHTSIAQIEPQRAG